MQKKPVTSIKSSLSDTTQGDSVVLSPSTTESEVTSSSNHGTYVHVYMYKHYDLHKSMCTCIIMYHNMICEDVHTYVVHISNYF